jgi:CheY-like chemotaxis protein
MTGRPHDAARESKERSPASRRVLIVHPDLTVLAAFQESFGHNGNAVHIARDLPTALLAAAENQFDIAVLASRVHEPGDGWALGGVLRRLFPRAFVAVIAETNVATLQQAINKGFNQLFDIEERSPSDIASEILSQGTASRSRVLQ